MSEVTVYQFVGYDFYNDVPVRSRRWATKEFIEVRRYGIAEGTAITVPEGILDNFGLTPPGYNPDSVLGQGGFQTRVK